MLPCMRAADMMGIRNAQWGPVSCIVLPLLHELWWRWNSTHWCARGRRSQVLQQIAKAMIRQRLMNDTT